MHWKIAEKKNHSSSVIAKCFISMEREHLRISLDRVDTGISLGCVAIETVQNPNFFRYFSFLTVCVLFFFALHIARLVWEMCLFVPRSAKKREKIT